MEHKIGINVTIHPTAILEDQIEIGDNTIIEAMSHLSSGCKIGKNCRIHRNVFIDHNVQIGNNVKIQHNNSIYEGVTLEDGVFIGTNVSFTNDKYPRSINPDGTLKTGKDWTRVNTLISYGASIGSGATIVCGVTIGRAAMIGAGSVVTKSIADFTLAYGNPATPQKTINL